MTPEDMEYLQSIISFVMPFAILVMEYYIGKSEKKENSTIAVILNILKQILISESNKKK